jgi:hypothetical protein
MGVYWGTPDDVAPRIVAEVEAGARHLALCSYVGFLSRADAADASTSWAGTWNSRSAPACRRIRA